MLIDDLQAALRTRGDDIRRWFATKRDSLPALPFSSVDVRNAGFKLAPVDTNLFPGGFNNLSAKALAQAVQRFRAFFSQHYPRASSILLIPEGHTRNRFYLDNVAVLQSLLRDAGFEVRLGWIGEEFPEGGVMESASGHRLTVAPLTRVRHKLLTQDGWAGDLVVLNHDLTRGVPPLLLDIDQPVLPAADLGWHRRSKSEHFANYASLARELAAILRCDPWHLSATFGNCGRVDFAERTGLECVALEVEKVLHATRRKYEEYGITSEPYAFVKADSGTYGMGIMTVRSGDDVMAINKDARKKMRVVKEGAPNTVVIIQEGVPTIDQVNGAAAEPMLYLVAGHVVGGAFRTNTEKDQFGNLNSSGMAFVKLCDDAEHDVKREKSTLRMEQENCYFDVFTLIAELATLAACQELADLRADQSALGASL